MVKRTGQFSIHRNYVYSWICQKHDCLPHDLLIAKLGAYGLDRSSLTLLMDYLNSHKQQTKVGSSYSK